MSGRKRSREFEEDDDHHFEHRPHISKRQRIPPVVQLCKEMMPDIATIGESKKAFADDIKFLSEAISNEYGHEEYFNNALLSTFLAVVTEQPQKQPGIALLTMAVNSHNEIAGKSILNFFYEELQKTCNDTIRDDLELESNETGPWNKAKLLLRFLSLLSPMLLNDDIISVYRKFFEVAIELNKIDEEKRNPLAEAIYTNTSLNIPYLFFFIKTDEDLQKKVDDLVSFVEGEFIVKSTNISLLKEYDSNPPYEVVELPQVVLSNIKKVLANNMEQLTHVFANLSELLPQQTGDQGFNDALQMPTIEALEPFSKLNKNIGSVDSMWRTPNYVFHVYLSHSTGDFDTVIPVNTYAGQLFRDIYIDIVESLEFNRNEVAKQLVTLDLFFNETIFAEAGISIADLTNIYEEDPLATTYKIEDIAIETVLSLIFKLPTVSQPFAYFYTLLVDICQNSPKAIAPVFGRAFRFFYNNIDNLDFELKLRFLDWFSIQMSNFNFSWKWNEWDNDSRKFSQSFYNPKITFIRNLVRKELRLTSSPMDVDNSLPDEFKQYLDTSYFPSETLASFYQSLFSNFEVTSEDISKNDLFFKLDRLPFGELVTELVDYIHKQNDAREIAELEEIIKKLKEQYGSDFNNFDQFLVVLITQCLVHCGSRSLSHANKYISDLQGELKEVFDKLEIADDVKESAIINSVLGYWNSNSQNGYLIVDAFKFAGFVSSESIYKFCFNNWNGKIYGLTDVTAIDSIFRTLSQQVITNPTDTQDFESVFEKLCIIINETVTQLNVQMDEPITVPTISEEQEISTVDELPKLDLLWKYSTTMRFCKSLLRKYSDQYKLLTEKLIGGMDNAIPHIPTRNVLLEWAKEAKEL